MSQLNQEFTAGRIQPSQYDVILPPDAQAEILKPKRARIPVRPPPPSQKSPRAKLARFRVYSVLGWSLAFGAVMIMIAVALSWPSPEKFKKAREESADRSRSAEEKADEALKALRSSSTAPTVQPTPAPSVSQLPPAVAPPKAQLVSVEAKRAILLRLPWQELGVYKWYELPNVWGGGSVLARYLGTVGRFSQIPPNPTPGDLWNVTETGASWVYCFPQGYNHAVWIDP